MDRLTAIHAFLQVAETNSFSKAAVQLNMSRSMVTRYIDELESWVGVRLFQRSTRNVSLTNQGEFYLEQCKEIQSLVFGIETRKASSGDEPKGLIRVSASVSFAQSQFNKVITQYLKKYPKTFIDLIVSDKQVNLIEDKIDFAIRISNNLESGIIAKRIGTCHSVLVASPAYLKKNGHPKKIQDLERHQCISHNHFGKEKWLFTKDNQAIEFYHNNRFTSNETLLIYESVLSHQGVAMLPTYLVTPALQNHKLVPLLPEYKLPEMGIFLVFTSKKYISPAVRKFIDFLSDEIPKSDWHQL